MGTAGTTETISDLVHANHILCNEGVVDGFGHVSVRDERDPERFWLARSMAPAMVTQIGRASCRERVCG